MQLIKKTNVSIVLMIILLATTGLSSLHAQEVELSGVIRDSLQNPLVYVNIIATPISQDQQLTFSISNKNGDYKLKLAKNTAYQIAITHLGYSKHTDTVQISDDTSKNFTLYESTQTLEEVLVKAEMAMIVKKDTITYRVDNFRTGEERKLRELLKNLPGMEVDRAGNVTVNGKKVTKLLVGGKQFFTGDEKLGVNNIPADAVEEITVLDDYHEVPFMKNLSESDEMALNIKLKEGKKKFVFGEIEVGGGVKDRYLFHPTLFYYSPATAINVIGDFNNIGKKSFTIKDYIDFEGGFASFMDDPGAYFNLQNSDFAQFLSQRNFVFQKNEFGAVSFSQELGSTLRLSAYSINSFAKTDTKTTHQITYLTETKLSESRRNTTTKDLFFSLNKLELNYNPNYETDLTYEALVKISNGDSQEFISSHTPVDTNSIRNFRTPKSVMISQNLELNKQFSYAHTSKLSLNYTYRKSENTKDWLFDQPVFSGIIPFVEDGENFNLLQNTASSGHHVNFRLKHYWVLNNFNHIYPVIGARFYNQTYGTLDFQQLQDGSIHGFQNSGFNNELDFRMLDNYVGFEYKRKLGDLILKPGLIYHYFLWNVDQFGDEITNKSKWVLLPKIHAEINLNSSEKVHLDYKLRTHFASVSQYANRLRLQSFNQLYRGNENLENQLYHQVSFRYYQFNLFKGTFLNAGISYTKRLKSVKNATIMDGIDQINTSIYTEIPQNSFSVNGSYAKQLGKFKLSLNGSVSFSNYGQIINEKRIDFHSQNYHYTFKAETRFENLPNLELGFQQHFTILQSQSALNKFMQLDPYLFLEYDFSDFILKADYTYNYYENQTTGQTNQFQIGGASLFYGKEDSLWSFELAVENLFDVRYKNQNSFSQFLISERNIFIQPRTVLFKIAYKL